MAVHAPGRSPLPRIFRPARSARALPSIVPFGPGRRRVAATLSMTSLIDVMVVCVVFLLATFSASAECGCRRDLSRIPSAANVEELLDAPMVTATADGILVDGQPAEGAAELGPGRPRRLDKTFSILAGKRALSKRLGGRVPSHVILAIDGDLPAGVVKSLSRTVAASGYTDVDFLVNAAPRPVRD